MGAYLCDTIVQKKEYVRLGIALNMLLLSYIVEHTGFDPFYVQMALIPLIVIFNFFTAKYWSLRRAS